MSTWTFDQYGAAALTAALFLAGCGGPSSLPLLERPQPAPNEVTLTRDRLIVAGPPGFCVDPTATRDRGETAFALLGNCAAISNSARARQPEVAALLTLSVSQASQGSSLRESIPSLDTFFRSQAGLRLLSRSRNPESVTILDSFRQGDIYFLHARDTSATDLEGVRPDYWRAYLDLGPRIATLSVLGLEGQEITDEQSLATLRAFVARVTRANAQADLPLGPAPPATGNAQIATVGLPAASETVQSAPPSPATAPATTAAPLRNVGLFRRIFR